MAKLKNALKITLVVFLILCSLFVLSKICQRKDSTEKYHDFFKQDENFDVLFYGSSHVINGIYPMDLWRDYGIVSYNFGGHANLVPTSYWVMRNSLDYTKPKLAVLDVLSIQENKTVSEDEYAHISFDAFPISKTKIDAVRDLWPNDTKKQSEFLFTLSLYHNRWNELNSKNIFPHYGVEKGAETEIHIAEPAEWTLIPQDDNAVENTLGMDYLRRFIEYCQERDIDVLLVRLPFPATFEGDQRYGNAVKKIADEYGVNYINFFYEGNDKIDFDIDMFDPASHLNPSGARKISAYLGEYIKENYDIPDQRDNEKYAFWNKDYKKYYNYKFRNLDVQQQLSTYLLLLYDKDFYSEIFIDSSSRVDKADGRTAKLLDNIKDYSGIKTVDNLQYEGQKCDILINVYNTYTQKKVSVGAFVYDTVNGGDSIRIMN